MQTKNKEKKSFWEWLFKKWHFWLLSVGWGIWSASENIISGNFAEASSTVIFWTIFILVIYLIIFYIKKGINKTISKRVEEEVKSKIKK